MTKKKGQKDRERKKETEKHVMKTDGEGWPEGLLEAKLKLRSAICLV